MVYLPAMSYVGAFSLVTELLLYDSAEFQRCNFCSDSVHRVLIGSKPDATQTHVQYLWYVFQARKTLNSRRGLSAAIRRAFFLMAHHALVPGFEQGTSSETTEQFLPRAKSCSDGLRAQISSRRSRAKTALEVTAAKTVITVTCTLVRDAQTGHRGNCFPGDRAHPGSRRPRVHRDISQERKRGPPRLRRSSTRGRYGVWGVFHQL